MKTQEKIVAVVPMKLNNVRLPNKNTKPFRGGEPLCSYILKELRKVEEIEAVYVYCSNEDIRRFLPEGVRFLKRGKELDGDQVKMNEVLARFGEDVEADIYVMAHTTAPFVKAESIRKGIRAVLSGNYDSAFSVKKLQDFLWKDGRPFNYSPEAIPRTQDLEELYCETSGFYIYQRELMEKFHRRVGFCPYLVTVGEIESIDIDEKEDFEIADAVHSYLRKERVSAAGGGRED